MHSYSKFLTYQRTTGYTKRRPEELAVLTRWFRSADVEIPEAKMLDIILYSREQLVSERTACWR